MQTEQRNKKKFLKDKKITKMELDKTKNPANPTKQVIQMSKYLNKKIKCPKQQCLTDPNRDKTTDKRHKTCQLVIVCLCRC